MQLFLTTLNFSCVKDSTLERITAEDGGTKEKLDDKKKRFQFQAFNFLRNQTAVYVHAKVKVCDKDDDG